MRDENSLKIDRVVLLITLIIPSIALSQSLGQLSLKDILKGGPDAKSESPSTVAKAIAMDRPVNPDEYFVGPGDGFMLHVWSSSPVEQSLTVTPEGTLLIPNVGLVPVADSKLSDVKDYVKKLVGKTYPNSSSTLTLVSPRRVNVQISGQVVQEGIHEIHSVQRVDQLIEAANTLPPALMSQEYIRWELPRLRAGASERNIIIRRRDGSSERVDLVKYAITGAGKYNPYLREGDVVHVPEKLDMRRSIGIFGGVNKFGSFEFVPGDSVTDLFKLGEGFKSTARSGEISLTRLSPDGRQKETLIIDGRAILEGKSANIALRPGDRLVIPETVDPRQNYRIDIEGEVVQPGMYPITRGGTRLSDAIRDAGGFTTRANLRAAILLRARNTPYDPPEEIEQERLLSRRASLGPQDSSYYFVETALRLRGERVAVDFHKLFAEGDTTQDVTLRTYDRIVVPTKNRTIFVFGQVRSPGHVPFVEGVPVGSYIERTGGFANDARTGDVKVIKASTRAWLDPSETTIEDGDFIWVPKEPHYPFSYYVTTYAQIASILGAIATVALLITSTSK